MTQEEKKVLIQDICTRLPYELKIEVCVKNKNIKSVDCVKYDTVGTYIRLMDDENFSIKLYLRPMSSMTEEEEWKYNYIKENHTNWEAYDYLNSIHIDYRGLIPMGLAIEAPKDMYKTE